MMLDVQAIMCCRQHDDDGVLLLFKSSPFEVERKKESKSRVPFERF